MIEKVSLYIPAFNAEQTIQQAINSAENQKAKFDEIIVVNDFSTDKTEEKIASFNNVKLINNKKNEGLGKSRNIVKESIFEHP